MPSLNNYQPIGEPRRQALNLNLEDTRCEIYGLKISCWGWMFYHFVALLFLGLPYVIFAWFPSLRLLKYKPCSLRHAEIILVQDNHGNNNLVNIKTENVRLPIIGRFDLQFFYYQHIKFVWVEAEQIYATLDSLIPPQTNDQYLDNVDGLFDTDYVDLLKLYGPNKIEVEVKSYWKLFIEEVFNPFYVFQAFSMSLWCFDHYYIYAVCVLILTVFSVVTTLLQTRKQSESLHDLVESSKCHDVTVLRQNLLSESITQEVDPVELVPGDLVVIPKANFILPCDMVLLNGQCIVNESMLTGESVPVTKTALHSSDEIYDVSGHKRHTLYCGTLMIQSRYYGSENVLARVVKTGFDTTKGALVKSILFPTPVGLKFYKDSLKFVFALFIVAAAGTGYCLYLYIIREAPLREILIRSLDIVTIVVPPALPAAMTVGIVYSQNRLKKLGIFCISPPRINVCGKIKLACFDKTGTLTHDGLDMHSVLPCTDSTFSAPITDCHSLEIADKLLQAMATCHSLTQIDNNLSGDPLDLSMFEFTKWELEEPGAEETARFDMLAPSIVKPSKRISRGFSDSGRGDFSAETSQFSYDYEIGIIRQFPFSSTLQCMSVICRDLNSPRMTVFTKGAPEKISTMCVPESLPKDFSLKLTEFATRGFRVIALAYKEMSAKFKWKEAQRVKRDVVECDLTFLGLLVMQNTLKPETTPVIKVLHNANIRTVMITGDNILTAISVARDCEMVKASDDIFILETKSEDLSSTPELILQNIGSAINTNLNHDNNVAININFNSNQHLAIDGKTWSKIKTFYPDLLPNLLVRTTVFARFQPDQKTQLITYLQSLDYVVSMVGDGANDCGALKAAHVGVSLSQAEASVAAPFTSSIQDISSILHLMLEGRCALVTSFAVFKYMALYSLIQFTTVLILYKHHSMMGDMQFLFIDLVITTVLAVTIGRQGPFNKLHRKRPMGSLVSFANLFPIVLQVCTCISVQVAAMFYLYAQSWFDPIPDDQNEEVVVCWENTVLFTVSAFQYVILACVYSKGKPYRQSLITNLLFIISALSLTIFLTFLLIYPPKILAEFFEIMFLPHKANHDQFDFRYKLLGLPIAHLFIAVFIERAIADSEWLKKIIHCLKRKRIPKNKYKLLLEEDFYCHTLLNRNMQYS